MSPGAILSFPLMRATHEANSKEVYKTGVRLPHHGVTFRLDGDLPSLPESRTGFGFSFEPPEDYSFRARGVVSVSGFKFTRPQDADGYVAGAETVTAEVRFNDKVAVSPSQTGGMPSLELRIGSDLRVASYVPASSATDVWRFTYALRGGRRRHERHQGRLERRVEVERRHRRRAGS